MNARPDSLDATGTATRIWAVMQQFVTGHDRRHAVRSALDLGPVKVELLIGLTDGPMTLREIARAIAVDPPAATVAVDLLEARGLVQRAPHPDDNRRKLVHLTDAGRQTTLPDSPSSRAARGARSSLRRTRHRLHAVAGRANPIPTPRGVST
jgi:DNA-binding HxlR family transcriptional regulator